eukprot:COSAG04_NODE_11445_length_708_cov_1.850575_1_plen_96_part_00
MCRHLKHTAANREAAYRPAAYRSAAYRPAAKGAQKRPFPFLGTGIKASLRRIDWRAHWADSSGQPRRLRSYTFSASAAAPLWGQLLRSHVDAWRF